MEISDMVVKILSAAAIAAAATSAQGAFSIGSVDFGGGFVGTNGSPLVTDGAMFAAPFGVTTDPGTHAGLYGAFGGAQGHGVGIGAIEDNAPAGLIPFGGAPGAFPVTSLDAFVGGAIGANSFGGFYARGPITTTDDDAFVARIGVTAGSSLSTSGQVFVAVQGLGDASETVVGIDESGVISVAGADNRTDGANYALEIRSLGNFGAHDVYDVYVVVPTPGTAALFGVAGLATIRRRRA